MKAAPVYWAIVPAAGVGRRMGGQRPKQYLPLLDKTVIEHSIERLLAISAINAVVVAVGPRDNIWPDLAISRDQRVETVTGGEQRYHSVFNGLLSLEGRASEGDWVLVHDAVRPCVTTMCISQLIDQLSTHEVGGLLGYPLSDTLKKVAADRVVEATVDRTGLWSAATPQMFRYGLLRNALQRQIDTDDTPTDEAMAVERLGSRPKMVAGRRDNIKITEPGDLELATVILQAQGLRCDATEEQR